ncbi:carcinoembryonic antigen-related cell adhesion molecule 6-like isoform X1 [Astyanax mexicanus]|uniref:Carcinoembryonic antigen-related cell adhesion molecule 6-like isoform X1 n=1 Tax=Astyanax mexicanus TaxID=7994 RepID=A0A8T2MIA0_ASTMX|nr:carcinoembryonic antigen-related cell adhesion molecule 6-like isoform X1 [Astyanax mexicanus]
MYYRPYYLHDVLLLLTCCVTGCASALVVLPNGPTLVNAFLGTNVTLGVTVTGASSPLVSWKIGKLTVASLMLDSGIAPDIASDSRGVLSVDQRGSLVFWNVPLSYSGVYTVTASKAGANDASANFTLLVYDSIREVSVDTSAQDPVEGGSAFTLSYTSVQGQPTGSTWYFNGLALVGGNRYSITDKSLTIQTPNRNDTGLYAVNLTNPFSSKMPQRNITVLYGPNQPVLEVNPTKAAFVSGETVTLSCRAQGEPVPSASWFFKGQPLPTSPTGTLNLTDVQTSQSGVYTCIVINMKTKAQQEKSVTINVRGLSGSALVGISAGIPCGILLVVLLIGLIIVCYFCYKRKDRNPRYPISRAVEKAVISQPELTKPHNLLSNGLKLPPDYSLYRQQTFAERDVPLPFQPAPVRTATTV